MGNFNLEFIKKRRQELNLSLQEMAESLGFKNASTYMKYEDGTYLFKANHLPILANKLNANIEDFFAQNFAEIAKSEYSATKEVV
ncbi:transcriptional regulator with XRE-family HTH domain [Paenibacillus sp. PastF-3]|uniref:helix-turn-helix domain-containing protein n=1 Tax=Paenibacillus sp. PastF-3 TaxID=2940626 RepID=UPI002476E50A|nr:helix-turn-helix transcriptional regulator [Paenibacillus sp. PastF-3]MDH6370583.1 transcriptional regulator with XRE-family HTH domain [Paenibacillus sp. PastF-3]